MVRLIPIICLIGFAESALLTPYFGDNKLETDNERIQDDRINKRESLIKTKMNNITLSSYFATSTPLCTENQYMKCLEKAKKGFQVCSISNSHCQCYIIGASIVECAQYCSSLNPESYLNFKNLCDTNPYILNYNETLYESFNENLENLTQELRIFQEITSSNLTSIDFAFNNQSAHNIFDYPSFDSPKVEYPFEKHKSLSPQKQESEIFKQRFPERVKNLNTDSFPNETISDDDKYYDNTDILDSNYTNLNGNYNDSYTSNEDEYESGAAIISSVLGILAVFILIFGSI